MSKKIMTTDIYEQIQFELWSQRQGAACSKLTVNQIADAFSEDAPVLCRRHISRLSRIINPLYNELRTIRFECNDDPIMEIIAVEAFKLQTGFKALVGHQRVLRSILAATRVKENGLSGNFEGISQTDVDLARDVGIETLYDFEKPKHFGGRFSACCPFHQENSPSFFVFKDNKFKCFSCSAHGDSIEFQMQISNCDFIEAVKYLRRL